MPTFRRDDLEIHYRERGRSDGTPVVLMHGLLFSSYLQERLAARLLEHRIVLLDLHGHGHSSKPTDAGRYTWDEMVADVVGLLDHLGEEKGVVGGLSLGANVALAMGQRQPERVTALVLEMPVMLRGHRVGRPVFMNMARTFKATGFAVGRATAVVRRVPLPRNQTDLIAIRDVASTDPKVGAAVLRGLLSEPPLPEDPETLARVTMPTLVFGHRLDPLHVLDDARDLVKALPDGRLVELPWIGARALEPAKIADAMGPFLDELRLRR